MMTSKTQEPKLCSLLFETKQNYNTNLQTLLSLIKQTQASSIIVASELCLTGFDYEHFEAAAAFAIEATKALQEASKKKIIILTMIEKRENKFFNIAKIFYNGEVVHSRAKAKLFRFGGEHKYFSEGNPNEVQIVEVAGVKIALLICFELRFKELWREIEGADIIAIPSWWGILRTEHFKTLTQALAIMNQCYVVASDSANKECSKMSAIITPQGEVTYNEQKALLLQTYLSKEVKVMRKYLDVGIDF